MKPTASIYPPYVIERSSRGERTYDIFSRMLMDRIVFLGTEIDDVTFFHETLARIVNEEDPTRYYQPSSPFSPDGIEPNAAAVPEPAAWTMMLVGFGCIGAAVRRRLSAVSA